MLLPHWSAEVFKSQPWFGFFFVAGVAMTLNSSMYTDQTFLSRMVTPALISCMDPTSISYSQMNCCALKYMCVCLASSAQLPLQCLFLHGSLGPLLTLLPLSRQWPWWLSFPPHFRIARISQERLLLLLFVLYGLLFVFILFSANVSRLSYSQQGINIHLYYVLGAVQCSHLIFFLFYKREITQWMRKHEFGERGLIMCSVLHSRQGTEFRLKHSSVWFPNFWGLSHNPISQTFFILIKLNFN